MNIRFVPFFIALLLFGSCQKQDNTLPIYIDDRLIGKWLLVNESFEEAIYQKQSRFGDADLGFSILDNGVFIERSPNGLCEGQICYTENFIGTYTVLSPNKIAVIVDNYKGKTEYTLEVAKIEGQSITVKK